MSDESKCPICKGEVADRQHMDLMTFVLLNAAREAYGDPTLAAEFHQRKHYEEDAHAQGFCDAEGPVYGFWIIMRCIMPGESGFDDDRHTRHATELGAIREALVLKGIDPDNLRGEE